MKASETLGTKQIQSEIMLIKWSHSSIALCLLPVPWLAVTFSYRRYGLFSWICEGQITLIFLNIDVYQRDDHATKVKFILFILETRRVPDMEITTQSFVFQVTPWIFRISHFVVCSTALWKQWSHVGNGMYAYFLYELKNKITAQHTKLPEDTLVQSNNVKDIEKKVLRFAQLTLSHSRNLKVHDPLNINAFYYGYSFKLRFHIWKPHVYQFLALLSSLQICGIFAQKHFDCTDVLLKSKSEIDVKYPVIKGFRIKGSQRTFLSHLSPSLKKSKGVQARENINVPRSRQLEPQGETREYDFAASDSDHGIKYSMEYTPTQDELEEALYDWYVGSEEDFNLLKNLTILRLNANFFFKLNSTLSVLHPELETQLSDISSNKALNLSRAENSTLSLHTNSTQEPSGFPPLRFASSSAEGSEVQKTKVNTSTNWFTHHPVLHSEAERLNDSLSDPMISLSSVTLHATSTVETSAPKQYDLENIKLSPNTSSTELFNSSENINLIPSLHTLSKTQSSNVLSRIFLPWKEDSCDKNTFIAFHVAWLVLLLLMMLTAIIGLRSLKSKLLSSLSAACGEKSTLNSGIHYSTSTQLSGESVSLESPSVVSSVNEICLKKDSLHMESDSLQISLSHELSNPSKNSYPTVLCESAIQSETKESLQKKSFSEHSVITCETQIRKRTRSSSFSTEMLPKRIVLR